MLPDAGWFNQNPFNVLINNSAKNDSGKQKTHSDR